MAVCRFSPRVAEQLTDGRQAEGFVDEQRGEGMPEIMLPEILKPGALADCRPGPLDIRDWLAIATGKNKRPALMPRF